MLEPIVDADLVERVRTRLRQAILEGTLAPGDRLLLMADSKKTVSRIHQSFGAADVP